MIHVTVTPGIDDPCHGHARDPVEPESITLMYFVWVSVCVCVCVCVCTNISYIYACMHGVYTIHI
jgi:hypothetical protein